MAKTGTVTVTGTQNHNLGSFYLVGSWCFLRNWNSVILLPLTIQQLLYIFFNTCLNVYDIFFILSQYCVYWKHISSVNKNTSPYIHVMFTGQILHNCRKQTLRQMPHIAKSIEEILAAAVQKARKLILCRRRSVCDLCQSLGDRGQPGLSSAPVME